jgi:hypothetical protein
MRLKQYTLRSLAKDRGKKSSINLPLEFEGERAFVVWDSLVLGDYELKARVEIDPDLLRRAGKTSCEFTYHGELVLPCPEHT